LESSKLFAIEELLTKTPFPLIDSDLFYIAYFRLPGETAVFFKFHHLIADAWSLTLIADNILYDYLHLKNNKKEYNELVSSYIEYITAEKEYLLSEQFQKNKVFWCQRVSTIPEFIYLKNRSIQSSTRAKRMSFFTTDEISVRINQYCNYKNTSVFILFIAIFSIYITLITSKKDICIGTTTLNRSNHKERNTIGMFINTIPIRLNIDQSVDFDSYINYLYLEWKNILRNQRYPINLLINDYRLKNQITDDLFDITINYQNAVLNSIIGFNKVKGRWHSCGYQTNSLNIHINNRENSNHYLIDYDYLIELFSAEEIESLHHHLMHILLDALNHPTKPVALIELMPPEEKHRLMDEFNPAPIYLPLQNLQQLFERQAVQNPENTALIFGEQCITYRELNQRANQIAWMLRSKGIKQNSIVGLLVKRSPEMFYGILGILKAGGAYMPIDSNFPRKRVKYILENSCCDLLLTNDFLIGNTTWQGEIVNFSTAGVEEIFNPPQLNTPDDLAYIIYTSGSTGKPKGVMIEHRSIVNTVNWRINHYHFNAQDVLLQIPPYNFDSSVEDIFSFLSAGATIVIIDQDRRLELMYVKELIVQNKVSHFLATPLLYNAMLDEIADGLGSLSSVTVAGENFHLNLVKKHFQKLPQVKLYNEYGPTENSVCSTVYQFAPDNEEILIGKPISNCRCYVLNNDLNLQPIGIPGELYLGGMGLARGYIDNPQLTAEKFIFVPEINERLYKTGDLARWTPKGDLQFIERIDNQVKIRGFRIEPGEIEFHLLKHPAIKEAVVVAGEDSAKNKYLCAYAVSAQRPAIADLKEFLAKNLPDYMIPAYFIFLDKLPLSPNGKIDKKALPLPANNPAVNYEPPENEVEAKLVAMWQEVLGITKIGTGDNFFEIGGDSLAVIRILTMSYSEHWDLSVQDFYKYSNIKELAALIARRQDERLNPEPQDCPKVIPAPGLKMFEERMTDSIKFTTPRTLKNILLTGATGFFGIHILFELLQMKDIRIYTLVRGLDQDKAESRLYQLVKFYFPQMDLQLLNRMVAVVNGDITDKRFGLPEADYMQLRQTIDTVIHAAACVKHYGDYEEFRKINVLGVQNIVQFSRDKYLIHISTTSIAGDYTKQKQPNLYFNENSLDIGQNHGKNCYVKTKFAAEQLVSQYMKDGLNTTVIRVGNLTGRYADGLFQINIQENKFYQILKSMIELSIIPKSLAKVSADFTPVDLCSEAVIRLLKTQESSGKTFHLINHNYIQIKNLADMLCNLGYKTDIVSDSLFYKTIQDLLDDQNSFEVLFGFIPDLEKGKLNYSHSVIIDSHYSVEALKQLDFNWPQVDQSYVEKVLHHMESVHFIKKGLKDYKRTLPRA
jgi:amino acid adenylation domain-containing protein/thioester reductase-like protein